MVMRALRTKVGVVAVSLVAVGCLAALILLCRVDRPAHRETATLAVAADAFDKSNGTWELMPSASNMTSVPDISIELVVEHQYDDAWYNYFAPLRRRQVSYLYVRNGRLDQGGVDERALLQKFSDWANGSKVRHDCLIPTQSGITRHKFQWWYPGIAYSVACVARWIVGGLLIVLLARLIQSSIRCIVDVGTVRCSTCGYNLRGHSDRAASRRCPECGSQSRK